MTSEEGALPDIRQNLCLFVFPHKQSAHVVSNHKLYNTAQKYKLVHLPAHFSGFHHLLSTWQALPGPYFWSDHWVLS